MLQELPDMPDLIPSFIPPTAPSVIATMLTGIPAWKAGVYLSTPMLGKMNGVP